MTDAYPYPRRMENRFDSEEEYADWLAQTLRRFGWVAHREVPSSDGVARADIIAKHGVWGVIGAECKFGERVRPRDWAQAYKQTERYSGKRFRGEVVDNWAVGVTQNDGIANTSQDERFEQRQKSRSLGYREFLNTLDCGVLNHHTRLQFVFNNSNPMTKPPIAEVEYPTGKLQAPSPERLEECTTDAAVEYLGVKEDSEA